jgi:hypothetical protein
VQVQNNTIQGSSFLLSLVTHTSSYLNKTNSQSKSLPGDSPTGQPIK